jgi:hypothetical protein
MLDSISIALIIIVSVSWFAAYFMLQEIHANKVCLVGIKREKFKLPKKARVTIDGKVHEDVTIEFVEDSP